MKDQKTSLNRQELRALIVQILYGMEFDSQNFPALKKAEFFSKKESASLGDSFVRERVKKIQACKEKLDTVISEASQNWRKERMSLIDLNIMRLATFEMLFCKELPNKVALNEALELSKKFGDDNSSRFINGILNQVLEQSEA